MTTEIWTIILSGLLTTSASILLFYLNRRANKKDTSELNRIIESVRSEFQILNDKNKAEIELLFHSKKDLLNEQKKAVLDFWDDHFTLIRLCDTTRYEIDELRLKDFYELKKKIEVQEEKCEVTFTRVYFLFENSDYLESCDEINIQCILIATKFLSFMESIELNLKNANDALQVNNTVIYKEEIKVIQNLSNKIDSYIDENDPREKLNLFKKQSWNLLYGEHKK
jgi:hypothetical protein